MSCVSPYSERCGWRGACILPHLERCGACTSTYRRTRRGLPGLANPHSELCGWCSARVLSHLPRCGTFKSTARLVWRGIPSRSSLRPPGASPCHPVTLSSCHPVTLSPCDACRFVRVFDNPSGTCYSRHKSTRFFVSSVLLQSPYERFPGRPPRRDSCR